MFIKQSIKVVNRVLAHQFIRFTGTKMGLPLKEITEKLQSFAPLKLAENWDNVGVLIDPVGPSHTINTVLLTNDLTEDVVDEAVNTKANLIVSYHPNIFAPLKTINSNKWKEMIAIKCIQNNIAVYSPHTSWDSVQGGVNDWLASVFQYKSIEPILKNIENPLEGAGRILYLQSPQLLSEIIEKIKSHIGIPHLRLALAKHKSLNDTLIDSVALCAGSGSSVLKGVKADLYLTGEMLHHDLLDATQNGINVILCNHSDSERGFLKIFQSKLETEILASNVNVFVSKADHDPIVTV